MKCYFVRGIGKPTWSSYALVLESKVNAEYCTSALTVRQVVTVLYVCILFYFAVFTGYVKGK